MKKLACSLLLSALALAAMATLVPKGTDVRLAFDTDLSSKAARPGDKLTFHVVDDVVVDGQVVIKKGTAATGTIEEVHRGRRFGVNARVKIRLDPIAGVDGSAVPIATRLKGKITGGGTDKAAIASGAGALVLGPIGLGMGYFVTGKEVQVHAGDTLRTEVSRPTEVQVSAPTGVQNAGQPGGH